MGEAKKRRGVRPSEPLPPTPPKPVHTPVGVSFEYCEPGEAFCLSLCKSDDVRAAVDCLRMLTTMTWQQVLATSGKPGNKGGLGYTPYDVYALRGVVRPAGWDASIRIAAVRFGSRGRVFGAYLSHKFHLFWFDPDHAIVPTR